MSILLDSLEYFDKNTEKYENFRKKLNILNVNEKMMDIYIFIYMVKIKI